MFSLILIILASTCNAIMDKVKFHYWKSIFEKWFPTIIGNKKRICIRRWIGLVEGYDNKYIWGISKFGRRRWNGFIVPVQLCDLWHFSKMWMVIFLCLSIVVYEPIFGLFIDFCIFGLAWNINFSLYFKKLLHYETNS